MIYKVNEKFFSERPVVSLINPPVNSMGGKESSHIKEREVGEDVIELVAISHNYNFGPADIEVVSGEEYVGNIFHNCAHGYVLEGCIPDYPENQKWSWVWTRGGVPDTKKIRRRIEDALRKGAESDIFKIAYMLGVDVH
jgi:hypothetical protein